MPTSASWPERDHSAEDSDLSLNLAVSKNSEFRTLVFLLLAFGCSLLALAQSAPNTPPTVRLISPPLATNLFSVNDPIPFSAEAVDADADDFIASVIFFERSVGIIGEGIPNPTGNTWAFTWHPVNGFYDVWAEATDSNRARTQSAHVSVQVVQGAIPQVNLIQVREGNFVGPVRFPVPMLRPPGVNKEVTVSYRTSDGSPAGDVQAAFGGRDFNRTTNTVVLAKGTISTNVTLNILGNVFDEPDRQFYLYLSTIDPADSSLLFTNRFVIRILDDDDKPTLSVANLDVRMDEGNRDPNPVIVGLKLEPPSGKSVEVGFSSMNGTAFARKDYNPLDPIENYVTFQPGQSQIFITNFVTSPLQPELIIDNNADEPDRTFFVKVSVTDTNLATLDPSQSLIQVTITDDDPAPAVSVDNVTVTATSTGPTTAVFTISLSSASGLPITINYATADGTARASTDYVASQGTFSFAPGQQRTNLIVVVNQQALNQSTKSFFLNLTNPSSATPGKMQGTGTILSGVPPPKISISDSTVTASSAGATNLVFLVSLSSPSGQTVTINYATADDTAKAGADYAETRGVLNFAPGDTNKTVAVTVLPQTINLPTNSLFLNLTGITNATPPSLKGTGTILPGVAPPTLSISDGTVTASSSTNTVVFTVTLSAWSGQTISVDYTTADGTAQAGVDYVASRGTLSFAPGRTSASVSVVVNPQTANQPIKNFFVTLTNVVNARSPNIKGTGTILPPPMISINDVALVEGNSATNAVLIVSLSAISDKPVAVDYTTVNGTALASIDFLGATNTLTFSPGQTTNTLSVLVYGDLFNEPNETFSVKLSNPINATLARGQGEVVIINDDSAPTVSIGDVAVTEGNDGTTTVLFPVRLSAPSGQTVTIDFVTADDTAVAGSDYLATAGVLPFGPGETEKLIPVTVTGDLISEADETFAVKLTRADHATIDRGKATGTILNDDPLPKLSIRDASVTEGDTGAIKAAFQVNLSSPSGQKVSVDFATANGTALAVSDYLPATETLKFDPGETSKTIFIQVLGDTLKEADEDFSVQLSNAVNAVIEIDKARGLIIDNDPLPTLSVNDVTVAEGDEGLARAVFSVSLSPASGQQVTVKFATADGTATAASEYVTQTGQLIFEPGVTNQTVSVLVNGDTFFEADENFALNLSDAVNATIAKGRGLATIVDDDVEPTLSIADVSILEGNAATTEAIFTVRLSVPSPRAVTVDFATVGETATPNRDFVERSGTLAFNPGETSKPVAITINADALDEPDETFLVMLSKPVNAAIARGQARGTILDDDDPPTVSISDATLVEGNSGASKAVFNVSLSSASGQRVSVAFATANGTATAYSDYSPNSGLLIFEPGQTSQAVIVEILGDTLSEANEDFFVDLVGPTNARLGKSQGKGMIQDDDALPVISTTDIQVRKGLAGTPKAVFTLSLSAQSGQTVSVDFATANGSAVAGTDYTAQTGTLVFAPGELSRTIAVPILPDASGKPTQTFVVNLTKPVNATIASGRDKATATIIDDRPLPSLSITDAAVTEGNSGVVNAVLTVSLSQPSSQDVTVQYATADGTAVAGSDYEAIPNTPLTFKPGETSKAISVAIKGDFAPEPEENFFVLLSAPTNATLLDDRAIVTITDDDTTVGISITDAAVIEPDAGTTNMVFTVSLSAPSSQLVTVAYATSDNTAQAEGDYASASGTVTFLPGVTSQTMVVQVKGDTIDEDDESFFVRLSNAKNAVILRDRAVGTITDNDPQPTVSISDAAVTEGNDGTVNANFAVTLSSASARFVSVSFVAVEGTATAGKDFQLASDALTFLPGTTSGTISVPVNGDTEAEPVESFSVLLSYPVNATLGNPRGVATIVDDDVLPTLTITDAAVREGNSGTSFAEFTVRLSAPSSQSVTVDFKTADRTATAGSDYTAASGTLTFAAGATTNSVRVPILGDATKEPDETFEVRLTKPASARLTRDVGLGTILDDDVLPTLTITDATVVEGNSGVTNAIFAVRLSTASPQTVSVGFQTIGGTATAGSDFKAASGTLEFAPGTISRTLAVAVNGDTAFEPDETFTVNLSNPVNALIARGQGLGTILNDDSPTNTPPTVRIINPANGTAFTAPAEVLVTVDAFDRDGTVSKVEFFAGSMLLGSATSAPYSLVWNNDAAGAYSLTARATDDKGAITVSEPANVLVSRRAAGAEVAIIRNFADPEISLIQNYLLEMGISSQVFEQEGLSFDALRDAKLVIWDDLGSATQGLTDQEVAVFRQAFDAEIPLYFIGETLAASTRNLSAGRQTQWANLIHLAPSAANRSDGAVFIDEVTKHPVISGHFGTVGQFKSSPNLEGKLQSVAGVVLLGSSGGADLIAAYEDPLSEGRVRTLTQNCRLTAEIDKGGISEQKKLFKNAVAWLMHKSFQALTDLSVTIEGPSDPVPAGREFTYTFAIQHQGEIEGTGAAVTISLGTGLKLSKSEFLQGTLTESNGTVIYALGNMASAQRSTLTLVLVPTIAGTLTTHANVAGNEPDPSSFNNTATIETTVTGGSAASPVIAGIGFTGQGFQLTVTSAAQGTFRVQTSTDLVRWTDVTSLTSRGAPVLVTDPGASKMIPRFYRVVSP